MSGLMGFETYVAGIDGVGVSVTARSDWSGVEIVLRDGDNRISFALSSDSARRLAEGLRWAALYPEVAR